MYKRKEFTDVFEAIRYMKRKCITRSNLLYIASKGNTCELVYRLK